MSASATIRHPSDSAEPPPVLPEIAITAVQESCSGDGAGPHYIRLDIRFDPGQLGNAVERREGILYMGPGAARRVAAAVERALGRGCRVGTPEPAAQHAHQPAVKLQAMLTAREREVLQLLAAGSTARESSSLLGISPRTVEFHRENIKAKLGVRSIAELTRIAVDAGMVPVAA
jgi:DNA-binding CsgD family transcriptional regulator